MSTKHRYIFEWNGVYGFPFQIETFKCLDDAG